jgi:aminoglycoside phosphotransferase (APT) family kinase protein
VIAAAQREALAVYLVDALGASGPVEILDEGRIAMGQSRAMHVLDLRYPGPQGPVERKVVLRVEQWGLLGTDSRDEVCIMRALHQSGFPVARILAYEPSTEVLEQPFFVMEFVAGTSVFDLATTDDYVVELGRLHRLDTHPYDFLDQPQSAQDSALLQVERWYGTYRSCLVEEPSPLVEEAAQWLRNHAPATDRVALVHGDPGPGNYMHAEGRITALVDWEFTHLGDPDEDWAYLIAMRGAAYLSETEWLERIERLTGHTLGRERLRYFKALNFLKGVAVDQTAHRLYVDRRVPAPNLLAIGTGVHLSALKRLCEAVL